MAKNGQKQQNKPFFAQRAKQILAIGQSPPQELEVGPRIGPYLLVFLYFLSLLLVALIVHVQTSSLNVSRIVSSRLLHQSLR